MVTLMLHLVFRIPRVTEAPKCGKRNVGHYKSRTGLLSCCDLCH